MEQNTEKTEKHRKTDGYTENTEIFHNMFDILEINISRLTSVLQDNFGAKLVQIWIIIACFQPIFVFFPLIC